MNSRLRWQPPSISLAFGSHLLQLIFLTNGIVATLLTGVGASASSPSEPRQLPQTKPPRLILVDLVVTDRQGIFVDNLRAEEVAIRERGENREILFFQLQTARPAESSSETGTLPKDSPTEEPAVTSLSPPPSRRGKSVPSGETIDSVNRFSSVPILFALDLLTLDQAALDRSRAAAIHFLHNEAAATDQVLLISIGEKWTMEQTITNDFRSIEQALMRMQPMWDSSWPFRQFVRELDLIASLNRVQIKTNTFLSEIGRRVITQAEALASLSRRVRRLAGRKSLVLWSGGYPENTTEIVARILGKRRLGGRLPHSNRRNLRGFNEYLERATDEANQSGVSIYSMDPRNFPSDDDQNATTLDKGVRPWVQEGDFTGPRKTLHRLAQRTGGLSVLNPNDLRSGLSLAYRDSREYYLIGYLSAERKRRRESVSIEIEVKRPQIQVRYRPFPFGSL